MDSDTKPEGVQELRTRLLATDLSLNNLGIQQIIEKEIADWTRSYHEKKSRGFHDCYGGPGEIPDNIVFEGQSFSPDNILTHVRARDATGLLIMRRIFDYRNEDPFYRNQQRVMAESIPETTDLDEIVMTCMCGEHRKSWRNLAEDMINADPESLPLTIGWNDAIANLYRKPKEDNVFTTTKPWYRRILDGIRT